MYTDTTVGNNLTQMGNSVMLLVRWISEVIPHATRSNKVTPHHKGREINPIQTNISFLMAIKWTLNWVFGVFCAGRPRSDYSWITVSCNNTKKDLVLHLDKLSSGDY